VALTDKLIDAATIRHWGRRSAPALADHRAYARAVIAEYERANGIGNEQTTEEREALDTALGLWVCPWRICNTKQAQDCRAAKTGGKTQRGCGAAFPDGTTLERARQQINWKSA